MQRILSKTLQSYGFTATYLASNGFDGIALAVEHSPRLIILDILMPELSGHLTLKILKHIKSTKDIPVLMVSALSDIENLGLAVKSGTAGFISKPFTRATIYDKLLNIFGKEELNLMTRKEFLGKETPSKAESTLTTESTKIKSPTDFMLKREGTEETPKTQPHVSPDQLLQHYQDDEKKSIDSIKKLLLKSKK